MSSPDEEVRTHGLRVQQVAQQIDEARRKQHERADRLDALAAELERLAPGVGVHVEAPRASLAERPARVAIPADLAAAAGCLGADALATIGEEYLRSVPAIPPLDWLDRFVVVSVGCLAALADFLLVGLPPKTTWTPSEGQGIIPAGWLSERLKEWTVDSDNWLADLCKVPFDRSVLRGTDAGFSPVNHRVLSFGHEPSPIGFVFGMMDIISGRMTGITYDGRPFVIPGVPPSWTNVCLAPITWLGHLVSDVATKMGIPVPGSGLFQLLRIPIPGSPGEATLADAARVAYQQGYDFRHYLAGAVVPGLVEGLIRLYDWLRRLGEAEVMRGLVTAHQAERFVGRARGNARLNALLFYTHSIAAAANTGRVAIQGATGSFFASVKSINATEWQVYAVRTVQFVHSALRDTDLEQAVKNRKRIEERWDLLGADLGTAAVLYTRSATDTISRVVL